MAKNVLYICKQKVNPQEKDAPRRFYAIIKSKGTEDTDEMAERISAKSTYTAADIAGFLKAMQLIVIENIKNGKMVDLGTIGKLRITLNSDGAVTLKDFRNTNIKKANLRFTPGTGMPTFGQINFIKYTGTRYLNANGEEVEI